MPHCLRLQHSTSILLLFVVLIYNACTNKSVTHITPPNETAIDSLLLMAEKLAGTDTQMAHIYFDKAMQSSSNKSEYTLAYSQIVQARILYYQDNYQKSIFLLDTAINYFDTHNQTTLLAKAYMHLSQAHACAGNYPEAIEHCLSAIPLNTALNNQKSLASNFLFLGKIYVENKDTDKALAYFKKAYNISIRLPHSLQHANVLSSLGMLHFDQQEFLLADSLVSAANRIQLQSSNIRHIAFTTLNLARIKIKQHNANAAILHLNEVEEIYLQLNERMGLVNTYLTYSLAFDLNNDTKGAFLYGEKAKDLAYKIESLGLIVKANDQMYQLNSKSRKFEEALLYFEAYHKAKQQLISNDKNRLIKRLETNAVIQNTKNESRLLAQKNKIKKQQLTSVSIISVSLTSLLLAILVVLRLKNKNLRHKQAILKKGKEVALTKIKLQEQETLILKNDLELKSRELTGKTLEILRQNETMQQIIERMEQLKDESGKQEIRSILNLLQHQIKENTWNDFHLAFNNVHKDFYDKLFNICQDFSSTEIKVAALLKLNLSTKEIAAISFKSENAVKTTRSRLRNKLKLTQGENLINFLMKI